MNSSALCGALRAMTCAGVLLIGWGLTSPRVASANVLRQPSDYHLYLPIVLGRGPAPMEVSPAGDYYCDEHEYGLGYGGMYEVSLRPDGTMTYVYPGPYNSIMTGTWTYAAANRTIAFTNFGWPQATYEIATRTFHAELWTDDDTLPTHEVDCWLR